MKTELAPSLIRALHRVDELSPPAPPVPAPRVQESEQGGVHRSRRVALVAAAAVAVAATGVFVASPWDSGSAEARFPVVEASEGVPAYLPTALPDGYELAAAERLPADPSGRGAALVTGSVDDGAVTNWVSATASPSGLTQWFDESSLDEVTTIVRSYTSATIDGEFVIDFDTQNCGVVTVTAERPSALLDAADRILCGDDGSLSAEPISGTELLYVGPRNTAIDDGLLLTYAALGSPDVQVHLRRFGYPTDLLDLQFAGSTDRVSLGDKLITVNRTDASTSYAWSLEPDNLIVVSSSGDATDGHLEQFITSLAPVDTSELEAACASVGVSDCS